MKLTETIIIEAPSEAVWKLVGSPDLWSLFHAKAERAKAIDGADGRVGSLYEIDFRLGSKVNPTQCEIVDLRVGRMIRVESAGTVKGKDYRTLITYELDDQGRRTKVTERIEAFDTHIPWYFRALIWVISRIGTPQGKTSLMQLKDIVEKERL